MVKVQEASNIRCIMCENLLTCIRRRRPEKTNRTPVRIALMLLTLEMRTCKVSYQHLANLAPAVMRQRNIKAATATEMGESHYNYDLFCCRFYLLQAYVKATLLRNMQNVANFRPLCICGKLVTVI
jgi:isoprenylcysteine carboxyl methyltransferase (ICMT) family protein YpbQ